VTSLKIPEIIPIFPLPETVLLPSEVLPLHIFEPRYRQMVRDALSGARIIGMTRLQPGYENSYEGAPEINPVGCAGVIAQHQVLPDGRYLIVLVGVQKFQVAEELPRATLYRQFRVEHRPEQSSTQEKASLQNLRLELVSDLPPVLQRIRGESIAPADLARLDDNQLVAVACQILQLNSDEKQRVLESESLSDRYLLLHEALELLRMAGGGGAPVDPGQLN